MDDNEEFFRLKKVSANFKRMAKENYGRSSRDRLKQSIHKRMQTNMIGGLARFEKKFGYLWGHGQDEDDLSQKERDFRQMWDELRNDYLTFANNNIRECLIDMENYSVEWNRYNIDFVPRREQ